MPLTGTVSQRIKELIDDNKKKGKERGANGKIRSRKQIIAIAIHSVHNPSNVKSPGRSIMSQATGGRM